MTLLKTKPLVKQKLTIQFSETVSYVCNMAVGTTRCVAPARMVAGERNIRMTLPFEVAPLHAVRTSRDVPTTRYLHIVSGFRKHSQIIRLSVPGTDLAEQRSAKGNNPVTVNLLRYAGGRSKLTPFDNKH